MRKKAEEMGKTGKAGVTAGMLGLFVWLAAGVSAGAAGWNGQSVIGPEGTETAVESVMGHSADPVGNPETEGAGGLSAGNTSQGQVTGQLQSNPPAEEAAAREKSNTGSGPGADSAVEDSMPGLTDGEAVQPDNSDGSAPKGEGGDSVSLPEEAGTAGDPAPAETEEAGDTAPEEAGTVVDPTSAETGGAGDPASAEAEAGGEFQHTDSVSDFAAGETGAEGAAGDPAQTPAVQAGDASGSGPETGEGGNTGEGSSRTDSETGQTDPETEQADPQPEIIDLGELFYQAEDHAGEIAAAYSLQEGWRLEKESADGGEEEEAQVIGEAIEPGRYELSGKDEEDHALQIRFSVVRLPIQITLQDAEKTYSAADPLLAYSVALPENAGKALTEQMIREELGEIVQREEGETVREGGYRITLVQDVDIRSAHFEILSDPAAEAVFKIRPLAVTVTPHAGQEKYYGEKDPETYDFSVTCTDPEARIDAETIKSELLTEINASTVLVRQPGEDVARDDSGQALCAEYPFALADHVWTNYTVSLEPAAFTIRPLTPVVSEKTITSREHGFLVSIAERAEKGGNPQNDWLDGTVPCRVVITAQFPKDHEGIWFEEELEAFIPGAGEMQGLAIEAGQTGVTAKIEDYIYQTSTEQTAGHGGKKEGVISWKGGLPAGTKLEISLFGENGVVSGKPARLSVVKQPVAAVWGSTADADPAADYLSRGDVLTLSALTADSREEYVRISRGGLTEYRTLDTAIDPALFGLAGTAGKRAGVTAVFADTLNLAFEEAAYEFTYDDTALEIPSSSIRFLNRDRKISLTLPEPGVVTQVSIPDAQVKLTGERGTAFSFDVTWSPQALIRSGSDIEVHYTDLGGNPGHGHGQTGRSPVRTPIRMQIRPDVNGRGYLTGSGALIVSGSACSFEQIRVNVAGSEQLTAVSGQEVWADESGSWELLFDRNAQALPERKEFLITAEYTDVSGEGALRRASYDAFVNAAALVTPVFRAMPCIGGVVEPGCAVLLHIGDHVYEVQTEDTESCGYFLAEDVEAMMPGDTFTIEVIDIAGNTNVHAAWTVPPADDPEGVTASLGPEGEFFYDASIGDSRAYTATPVRVGALQDTPLKLPLLFGSCYSVGYLTLSKTQQGIVIQSVLDPAFEAGDTCEITNETIYVYDHRPTVEELRNETGMQYRFGEEIPVSDDAAIWIVDGRRMRVQAGEYGDLFFRSPGDTRGSGVPEGAGQE